MPRKRSIVPGLLLAAPLVLGIAAFLPGIDWGLPSHRADRFLFAEHPIWSGRQIVQLAGADRSPDRAADVSAYLLERRNRPVIVNATDQDRARIVRRYRLMSYQPDEFTTFKSLSEMKPSRGDLDPRMYKYGGLWIYPVGAMLKGAAVVGWVRVVGDEAYYLDHPAQFGRFYVIARLYSAMWGLAGIVVVFALVKRISGDWIAAGTAAACFALMPIVVNAAHEAKPHLAGTVLMLAAVLPAARYAQFGAWRSGLSAALLCGAAIAMVPSAVVGLLVLPLMVFIRTFTPTSARLETPPPAGRRLAALLGFLLIAVAVYAVTNPYVPIKLVGNRAVLRSNFGNSAAFYHAAWNGAGLPDALLLVGEGTSFVLAAAGLAGATALVVRAIRKRSAGEESEVRRRNAGLLLGSVALAAAFQFVLFAKRQPADYARFALFVDVFLAIEAVVGVATFFRSAPLRVGCYVVLVATTAWMGGLYWRGFLLDRGPQTTRLAAAARLQQLLDSGNYTLATPLEPAPWSMPPANLFGWRIILPPTAGTIGQTDAQVTVAPIALAPDERPSWTNLLTKTPISWAAKPFEIHWPARR